MQTGFSVILIFVEKKHGVSEKAKNYVISLTENREGATNITAITSL
jgi:hypothetical protein